MIRLVPRSGHQRNEPTVVADSGTDPMFPVHRAPVSPVSPVPDSDTTRQGPGEPESKGLTWRSRGGRWTRHTPTSIHTQTDTRHTDVLDSRPDNPGDRPAGHEPVGHVNHLRRSHHYPGVQEGAPVGVTPWFPARCPLRAQGRRVPRGQTPVRSVRRETGGEGGQREGHEARLNSVESRPTRRPWGCHPSGPGTRAHRTSPSEGGNSTQ